MSTIGDDWAWKSCIQHVGSLDTRRMLKVFIFRSMRRLAAFAKIRPKNYTEFYYKFQYKLHWPFYLHTSIKFRPFRHSIIRFIDTFDIFLCIFDEQHRRHLFGPFCFGYFADKFAPPMRFFGVSAVVVRFFRIVCFVIAKLTNVSVHQDH